MVLTNTTVVGSGDGSTVQIHTALRSRLSTQDHTGNDHNSRAYTRVADSGNEGSVNLTHRRSHANEPKSASVEKKAEMQLLLRKVILEIQNDKTMSETEKAKKMQDLLSIPWKKYVNQKKKKLAIANALQNKYLKRTPGEITAEDLELSYHDREKKILGCKHYQRAVKLQCSRCNVWAVCRFCHDEFSEHCAIRYVSNSHYAIKYKLTIRAVCSNDTSRMMCMYCKTTQPIGQVCTNKDCGKDVSRYFCKTCLLWDSDPKKNIYHCDKCGICRIGKGLGIDYFHCDKCGVCLAICLSGKHRCIERNIDCDCPICGEYMFTSTSAIMFMVINSACFVELLEINTKIHIQIAMLSLYSCGMLQGIYKEILPMPDLFQISC